MALQLFVWREFTGSGGRRGMSALVWAMTALGAAKDAELHFRGRSIEVRGGASQEVKDLEEGIDLLAAYVKSADPQYHLIMLHELAVIGLTRAHNFSPQDAESFRMGVQDALRHNLGYAAVIASLNDMLRESQMTTVT